ncbi:hypothetical protein [Nonomuraea sp. CA-141351]|uniref:hypothetical protein n=1 Tax=Nonomuraea sp. CA-141351 TaxID=3239996 RepID=UPI003D8D122C
MELKPTKPSHIGYQFARTIRPVPVDVFSVGVMVNGDDWQPISGDWEDMSEAILAGFLHAAVLKGVTHVVIVRTEAGDVVPETFRVVPVVPIEVV